MGRRDRTRMSLLAAGFGLILAALSTAAEPDKKAWLENWQKKNPIWRALHLCTAAGADALTERFVPKCCPRWASTS